MRDAIVGCELDGLHERERRQLLGVVAEPHLADSKDSKICRHQELYPANHMNVKL